MTAQKMNCAMESLPKIQKAIIQVDGGVMEVFDNVPLPHVPSHLMLVKVVAVSLCPADWKMPGQFPAKGTVNGTDYAGVIVAIGSEVANLASNPQWKIGDEVFGACHGANEADPESGSFAQYIRCDPELLFKKPAHMSWEHAAAWGASGVATVGLSLFWEGGMGLSGSPDQPAEVPETVLVYAGSTSVGTLAIQLLRIYGHVPLTTCSPKNFSLVQSYGAEKAWDYQSLTCSEDIKDYTGDELDLILDPMTEAKTQRLCYQAMSRAGGRYIALEMWQDMNHTRRAVHPTFIMGSSIIGEAIPLGNGYGCDASAEKRSFGIGYYRDIQKLFDQGRLLPHPTRVIPGGFRGILEGLGLLKSKAISAQRLVVFLE